MWHLADKSLTTPLICTGSFKSSLIFQNLEWKEYWPFVLWGGHPSVCLLSPYAQTQAMILVGILQK